MGDQTILVHCRQTPYQNSLARAAIDFAMAAGVFNQQITVLFSGDALWQLLTDQKPEAIGEKNLSSVLSALPLYDISSIYVDQDSLTALSLSTEDLCLNAEPADKQRIAELFRESQHVFNF